MSKQAQKMTEFYCPCCGEWSQVSLDFVVSPGEYSVTCPECKTRWTVKVDFYEDEEGEEDEHLA